MRGIFEPNVLLTPDSKYGRIKHKSFPTTLCPARHYESRAITGPRQRKLADMIQMMNERNVELAMTGQNRRSFAGVRYRTQKFNLRYTLLLLVGAAVMDHPRGTNKR